MLGELQQLGSLARPSLTIALYRETGVTWRPDEELLDPRSFTDMNFIVGLKILDLPFACVIGASSSRSSRPPRPSSSQSRRSMEERFDRLERKVGNQRQKLRQLFSYQVAFNSSAVQLFNQFGLKLGLKAI